jgi:hypothetical protein
MWTFTLTSSLKLEFFSSSTSRKISTDLFRLSKRRLDQKIAPDIGG